MQCEQNMCQMRGISSDYLLSQDVSHGNKHLGILWVHSEGSLYQQLCVGPLIVPDQCLSRIEEQEKIQHCYHMGLQTKVPL